MSEVESDRPLCGALKKTLDDSVVYLLYNFRLVLAGITQWAELGNDSVLRWHR